MFHKLNSAAALQDLRLLLHFADGSARVYDMAPLLDRMEFFRPLQTVPGLFAQVQVDPGGYGVSWNDDIDLDGEELWAHGVPVETPFDGLLSAADAAALWHLNESTLRKALSYGELQSGVDALKFGKQWVVSREAMIREYGDPDS